MASAYDAFQSHVLEALNNLYTTLPAIVTKVAVKGTLTVVNATPLINRVSQEGYVDQEPNLEDIPVVWPRAGKFHITCPIEVGDTVKLSFCMKSAAEFKNSDATKPVTPENKRLHSLPDCFAEPSALSYNQNATADKEQLSIGSDDMAIKVTKEGNIKFGDAASESIVLGDAFITKFLDHKHEYTDSIGIAAVPTPSLTLGISTAPATPDTADAWASTLSTKVKTV